MLQQDIGWFGCSDVQIHHLSACPAVSKFRWKRDEKSQKTIFSLHFCFVIGFCFWNYFQRKRRFTLRPPSWRPLSSWDGQRRSCRLQSWTRRKHHHIPTTTTTKMTCKFYTQSSTFLHLQSNLFTTTTLGTLTLWPLLTGGSCSEVYCVIKSGNETQNGGRYSEVVVSPGLTVNI